MTQQRGMPTAAQKAGALKAESEVAKYMLSRALSTIAGFPVLPSMRSSRAVSMRRSDCCSLRRPTLSESLVSGERV